MIPLSQQHTESYSLPSGYGLHGTSICPGQVYLFVYADIDLSIQFTHPDPKKNHVTFPCINQIVNVPEPILIGRCFRIIIYYCTKCFVEPIFTHVMDNYKWYIRKSINWFIGKK